MSTQPPEIVRARADSHGSHSSDDSHDSHGNPKNPPPTPFAEAPINSFWYFLVANLIAATFTPIQDCDETFNYWEPTHYLSHGYGLQTWEYSPDYAIRSWTYIALHAVVGSARRLLPRPNKVQEFYFLRYFLAFVCALGQTRLFMVINNTINPRIAFFFFLAMVFSPGMFHASASFLPSSFAMYTVMFGMAAFMNWRGGLKTAQGIIWFAVGGIIGWPFSMALCAPFILEELIFATINAKEAFSDTIVRFLKGIGGSLTVLIIEYLISAYFYRRQALVPLNIVLYNVFGGSNEGPEIYGTEPWHFYIRNLLLNFNVWFVLAIAALPVFALHKLFSKQSEGVMAGLRTCIFMSMFYLWLGIFSLQPHKEERFMYPAYPCLALNAAFALHYILAWFGQSDKGSLPGKVSAQIKLFMIVGLILGSINIGALRIYGVYSAYSAPLRIYEPLQVEGVGSLGSPGDAVCFGKDWYRFPTSYFLPNGMIARFVKSEFDGLLPGQFSEVKAGFGVWPGASIIPEGMNNKNQEDKGKHVPLSECSFLVDTYFAGSNASEMEPQYLLDTEHWEEVKCVPFLDAANTHILGRTIWIPDLPLIPENYRRKWGKHCLLWRKL